jgi:hypothetical protein
MMRVSQEQHLKQIARPTLTGNFVPDASGFFLPYPVRTEFYSCRKAQFSL